MQKAVVLHSYPVPGTALSPLEQCQIITNADELRGFSLPGWLLRLVVTFCSDFLLGLCSFFLLYISSW